MFFVYVLRSLKDGRRYVGCTEDVAARLQRHNAGRVRVTRSRRPFKLIYSEAQETWSDARRREDFLKSGQGRAWLVQHGL